MSDRFHILEQIFHETMALPEEQRAAYLTARCGGDDALQSELYVLLQHASHASDSLRGHVAPFAATLLEPPSGLPAYAPGTMLGPYRIERVLGQGGMGVVYLADDTRLRRQVAVKTMGSLPGASPAGGNELLDEARAAAALIHPNIAALYDCGTTGGLPWFVMEYVPGVTLRASLRSGGWSELEVVGHGAQIAAALAYAHGKRLIHGDIKPENILMTDDGVIKIIDFGLARLALDRAHASVASAPLRGTLRYMAPENLAGQVLTPATDVYSAGVVLYEMATGEAPRITSDEHGTSTGVARSVDAIGQQLPNHPRLARVIARCLSVDPSARYRDGAELAAALAGAAEEAPVIAHAARSTRLVVLDFVCMTGGDGWLGTAIAESIAAELSRLEISVATRRRVAAGDRSSGRHPSQQPTPIERGRALAAQWVVSGTYEQPGTSIRVAPTVVHVPSGAERHLRHVEGHLEAIFELQGRIVTTLLEALSIEVGTNACNAEWHAGTGGLLAYEHYGRGRQCLHRMDAASLRDAIWHFEQVVQLDGGHALAYSGLGTAYSLQFLRTSNPDDVARASTYLERATSLDPTLGEPYPWLVNLRFRQNQPVGALEAAARGVALQPDLPEAHYFCGGVHYMMAESPLCDVRTAPRRLTDCIELQPLFHPAWIVLGATAMFLGAHAAAIAVLAEARALDDEPALAYRFVGAHTLQGLAFLRAREWGAAAQALSEALTELDQREHVYRDTFRVLSCCGLGDVALRTGSLQQSLSHYREARRMTSEAVRMAGSARLTLRADAGLAAAYAATGDADRARQLVDNATAELDVVAAHTGTITFECGLGQLCLDLAVAEGRLGRLDRAASLVARAIASGWQDRAWLNEDPELQPVLAHPVAARAVAGLTPEGACLIQVPRRPTRTPTPP